MQDYWLTNLNTGECVNVNAGTVERVLNVDISYIDWVLKTDGKFENGTWRVQSKVVVR